MASEWIKHVLKVKKDKKLSFKDALKIAKKTYKKEGKKEKKTKRTKRKHRKQSRSCRKR